MTAPPSLLPPSASADKRGWHVIPHKSLGQSSGYDTSSLWLGLHTRHRLCGLMLFARPPRELPLLHANPRVLLTVTDQTTNNEIFRHIVHVDDVCGSGRDGEWRVFSFSPSTVHTHTVVVTATLLLDGPNNDNLPEEDSSPRTAALGDDGGSDLKYLSDVFELTATPIRLCAEQPETMAQRFARLSDPNTLQGRLCRMAPPLAVTVLAVEVVVQRFGVRLPRVVYAALLAVLSVPLGLLVGFLGPFCGAQLSRRRGADAAAFGFIPLLTSPSAAAASFLAAGVSILAGWRQAHGLWVALLVCLGVNAVIFTALCGMLAVL